MRYYTINLENSEEQLLSMNKVVHIYGALTTKSVEPKFDEEDKVQTSTVTTACSKCGKEESVHKLVANL